jgi:hypothetical protein
MIEKVVIGNIGFYLTNVLTPEECDELIKVSESHNMVPVQTKESYRKMDHTMFKDEELANKIWSRINGYLPSELTITSSNINIYGDSFCAKGNWRVFGLNPMWRCGKYNKDGLFAPHRDGHYNESLDSRSFFTFMIYLNDDYEGGNTNFLVDTLCDVTTSVSIRVKQGTAIIFPHNYLHEGNILITGTKYIFRSDIMYHSMNAKTNNIKQAYELFKQATTIEHHDPKEAVTLYRRAIKLCPSIEKYL